MKAVLRTTFILGIMVFASLTNAQEVEWTKFEDLAELLAKEPRPVIIDVYTTWCGPCKMMYKQTYGNVGIAKYLNDNFYVLKLDAESKEDIEFQDHVFKWVEGGRNGLNQLALAVTGNQLKAYPTTVFLTEKFEIIQVVPGFIKPNQFEPIINYFGDGSYKNKIPWQEYQKNFKSSL